MTTIEDAEAAEVDFCYNTLHSCVSDMVDRGVHESTVIWAMVGVVKQLLRRNDCGVDLDDLEDSLGGLRYE